MPESGPYGSVRGARGNSRLYRDPGSKSEVGQSQRHVGLALKSRLELDIAAGQRWAKCGIAPPIILVSLDLRAEPDLFVAAARLVGPRYSHLEGGPRRELVVPRVDARPALL